MTIAVDFDGTCTTYNFPQVGEDIGAVPVLKELVAKGHKLILWTMRSNVAGNTSYPEDFPEVHNGNFLDDAVRWFSDNGIPLYGIQSNPTQKTWTSSPKAYAQMYIDDAALGCPLKWDETLSERPFVCWESVRSLLKGQNII